MKKEIFIGIVACVMVVVGVTYFIVRPNSSHQTPKGGQSMLSTIPITIKNIPLTVEVASTDEEKSLGLSGRSTLKEGGMLFIFEEPTTEGFWMKDMQFSLDILWADKDGKVVTIFENISPETYPTVFKPTAPALFVLEVPAGFVKANSIAVGDKINL